MPGSASADRQSVNLFLFRLSISQIFGAYTAFLSRFVEKEVLKERGRLKGTLSGVLPHPDSLPLENPFSHLETPRSVSDSLGGNLSILHRTKIVVIPSEGNARVEESSHRLSVRVRRTAKILRFASLTQDDTLKTDN